VRLSEPFTPSQGAGIETRAAHHKTLNVHARGSQRSQHLHVGVKLLLYPLGSMNFQRKLTHKRLAVRSSESYE
jgi:hypothetical protein